MTGPFVMGIHPWLVNSPHKWPLMQKSVQCQENGTTARPGHGSDNVELIPGDLFTTFMVSIAEKFNNGTTTPNCICSGKCEGGYGLWYCIDGLVQDCGISRALVLEIPQPCIKLSIYQNNHLYCVYIISKQLFRVTKVQTYLIYKDKTIRPRVFETPTSLPVDDSKVFSFNSS